ncbi:hypothetical protein [uncultured Pantoea sp.]|uniref:hypothetical protein n=1 Tax=uncultured Pantoea sp. TaxID=218084 RepID=UPI0025CF3B33|nr:hypothetical protein [uncultured Pantoea sp.]
MNTTLKGFGLALTTVFCTTQAQAVQTPSITYNYVIASVKPSERRGVSFLTFARGMKAHLKRLSTKRQELDVVIEQIYRERPTSSDFLIPEVVSSGASRLIEVVRDNIMQSQEVFDTIIAKLDQDEAQQANLLRAETVKELNLVITSMESIIEINTAIANEIQTDPVVIFDIARMENALKGDTIIAPSGLSREEKRKFILSHAI